MRRLMLLIPACCALAVACSSTVTMSKSDLEKQAADKLNAAGQPSKAVSCPGDLTDPKPGATMRCTLTKPDGSPIGVTVTVTGTQDSTVDLDYKVDNVWKQADIEKQTADALEKSVGQRPDKVVCPGDIINPQTGSTTRCTIMQNPRSECSAYSTFSTCSTRGPQTSLT